MKSQGLPIQTIVLIVIAIVALAAIIIFFFGGFAKSTSGVDTQTTLSECQSYCQRMNIIASKIKWLSSTDCKADVSDQVPEYCSNSCNDYMSCIVTFEDGTRARIQCNSDGSTANCAKIV